MASNDIERFESILKPAEDKRDYLGLRLSNNLKVLLVSDPETDISAASLSVHVGSMYDPFELQGLAHFLEHMLFMGTKKYPSEDEYTKFLSKNGGSSNAYTSDTITNFYFDVSPDALEPALDRFAQFFIEPLMLEDSVNRELEAVNSEYFLNLDNDDWRLSQLSRSIGEKTHDYCKFNIGNWETLRDEPKSRNINVRDALLEFHRTWYSANIMTLCVLGKESIDDLIKIIVPLFSPIVNKETVPRNWPIHPYTDNSLMKIIHVVPIKEKRTMDFIFKYPDETNDYKSNPGSYISHLIGHEGKGSLLSELKKRSLCSSLVSYSYSHDGFGFFHVIIDLTEEAMNRLDEIVQVIFQYIDLLKKEGPKEYIFEEKKRLGFIRFNFMEKKNPMDYVRQLSSALQYYPFEDILSANILVDQFDSDLITQNLSYLKFENCNIAISSKSFEGETDLKEKYFGTNYKIENFSQSFIELISNPGINENLKFPEPNEFLPTDFEIVKSDSHLSVVPVIIRETDIMKAWYLKDETYLKPKVFYGIKIINPLVNFTPDMANANSLFPLLFKDALTEFLYDPNLAGLSCEIFNTTYGINLEFYGYNHKMEVFLSRIFEKIISFEICPKRFEILKEKYVRVLKDYKTRPLYTLSDYFLNLCLNEIYWSYESLLSSIDNLTIDSVSRLIKQLFSCFNIELFFHGNISKENALKICNIVETNFINHYKTIPMGNHSHVINREVMLEPGCCYRYETPIDIQKPKVINTYFQVSFDNLDELSKLQMIDQLLQERFFDVLRTKEQLGYVVYNRYKYNSGVSGLSFVIQSEYDTNYLDERIEAFIAWAEDYIEKMSSEEFESFRKSLLIKLLKKKKKLFQLSMQMWVEIQRSTYDFKRNETIAEKVKLLSKDEVLVFFKTHFHRDSSQRRKISVRIIKSNPELNESIPTEKPAEYLPAPQVKDSKLIEDVIEFKVRKSLYPLPTPKPAIKDY